MPDSAARNFRSNGGEEHIRSLQSPLDRTATTPASPLSSSPSPSLSPEPPVAASPALSSSSLLSFYEREVRELSLREKICAAGGAAVVSAVVMNPLDVVKTRLHAQLAGFSYLDPPTSGTFVPYTDTRPTRSFEHPHRIEPALRSAGAFKYGKWNTCSVSKMGKTEGCKLGGTNQSTLRLHSPLSSSCCLSPSPPSSLLIKGVSVADLVKSPGLSPPSPALSPSPVLSSLAPLLSPASEPRANAKGAHYRGSLDAFYSIISKEGLKPLWRGTGAALVIAIPTVGIYLPLYDLLRDRLQTGVLFSPFLSRSLSSSPLSSPSPRSSQHAAQPSSSGRALSSTSSSSSPSPLSSSASSPSFSPAHSHSLSPSPGAFQLSSPYAALLAGTLSRSVAVLICSPLELARTRMQAATSSSLGHAPPRSLSPLSLLTSSKVDSAGVNSRSVLLNTLRTGSRFRLLWTGVDAQLARDVPFSAICWAILEPLRVRLLRTFLERRDVRMQRKLQSDRNALQDRSTSQNPSSPSFPIAPPSSPVLSPFLHSPSSSLFLSPPAASLLPYVLTSNFCAGAAAGTVAAAVTAPLDVAKTRMQIESSSLPGQKRRSVLETLKTIAREGGGAKALFTGWAPRVLRAGPSTGIVVAFYEGMKVLMHEMDQNE